MGALNPLENKGFPEYSPFFPTIIPLPRNPPENPGTPVIICYHAGKEKGRMAGGNTSDPFGCPKAHRCW